jgi:hypothetical protein
MGGDLKLTLTNTGRPGYGLSGKHASSLLRFLQLYSMSAGQASGLPSADLLSRLSHCLFIGKIECR